MVSSNSHKKWKKIVIVVKTNSLVRFLGEFEDTKTPFEIIGPLGKWHHMSNSFKFQGLYLKFD